MNDLATRPAGGALAAWFTPDRRAAIQAFLGTLAPFAILLGFGTESVWEQGLILAGAALQFIAGIISLVNVRDAETAWAIVRGAVYALAATASPALVLLGLYDEATNATILTAVSLGLSALSSLLAILIGKQQQIDNAVRLAQESDGTWSIPAQPFGDESFLTAEDVRRLGGFERIEQLRKAARGEIRSDDDQAKG